MYVGIANNSEYYISFINNLGSIAKFFLINNKIVLWALKKIIIFTY